jgi:HEAT repeat protein
LWDTAPDEALELVRQLLRDPAPEVALAAGTALEQIIDRASPARRIEIVCDLTVSMESAERVAVARALSRSTPLFVTDIAITELSRDTNAQVRALALSAAERHFREAPETYRALAVAAAADPDAAVRAAARRLLGSRRGDGAAGTGVT